MYNLTQRGRRRMRIRFRTCRRIVGIAALLVFVLSFVGCEATSSTAYDYQGADLRITLVMNAIDIQIESATAPAGWSVIDHASNQFNGLAYWNPVFTANRVMVPFAYVGAAALLLVIACFLPDYLLSFLQAHRRWNNRCVACGYMLEGNTSGVCPECGTAVPKPASACNAGDRTGGHAI